jgi:hypothetical protein
MSLLERLGKHRLLVLAVEFSLALCLIYSLLSLAGYFGLSFYDLTNRGMVEHHGVASLFSESLDRFVWCGGIFVALAGLFYGLGSSKFGRAHRVSVGLVLCGLIGLSGLVIFGLVDVLALVLVSVMAAALCFGWSLSLFSVSRIYFLKGLFVCVLFAALFIELAALVLFNVPAVLNLNPQLWNVASHWNSVELVFSNLAYPFLPYAYLLFVLLGIVCFAVKVAPNGWASRIGWEQFSGFFASLKNVFELNGDVGFEFLRGRLVLISAILVGAVVSCLFVLFTVLPWANPTNMLVSVDSPDYYRWIAYMHSVDVNGALSFAFANDRALFLILAYALSFVASPLVVIQFVAALLIVLFGFVSLLAVRLLCSLREVWVFAVLLVPFSFQALGLIYAGYFANMLALILVFVYLVLFFRVLGSWSSLRFFALLGTSVLVLLSHSWTWFVFALSLLMYLFVEWRLTVRDRGLWRRFKEKGILVGATVGVGLLVDLARSLLSSVSSSGSVLAAAHLGLGFPNLGFLLSGMQKTVDFSLGGVFANGLLVAFSIVGFLVLVRVRSEISNFLVSWIFVASVSILFAAQDFVFDRFLFLMPWVFLSSLGLFSVLRFASNRFSGRLRLFVCFVVLAFVFLALLNNGLRYLFNINIW